MTHQGPLPFIPGVVRVRCFYADGSVPLGGSRFFMSYTGGPPDASGLGAFASHVQGQWNLYLAALMSSNQAMTGLQVTDLSSDHGVEVTTTGGAAGTRTGGTLPAASNLLINWLINRHYRGGKPRMYLLAGVDTDTTDSKHWTSAFLSTASTAVTAFVNALGGTQGNADYQSLVNVPYYKGHVANTNDSVWSAKNVPLLNQSPTPDNIVGFSLNPVIGSQRRRYRSGS